MAQSSDNQGDDAGPGERLRPLVGQRVVVRHRSGSDLLDVLGMLVTVDDGVTVDHGAADEGAEPLDPAEPFDPAPVIVVRRDRDAALVRIHVAHIVAAKAVPPRAVRTVRTVRDEGRR